VPKLRTPKPPCSVQDCETESWRLYEYCRKHQARLMRTGTVKGIEAIRAINRERKSQCVIEDCYEPVVKSRHCEWHYDDYREGIRLKNRDNWEYMIACESIDYDDFWEWMKKELKLA
jgi:hypothetical protein